MYNPMTALCVLFLLPPLAGMASECDAYLQEAEAVAGVAPRFDDDGSFRSLLIYATADFIAPKPSLINAARDIAEMSAKRDLAAWMEEQFSSTSTASVGLNQTETTDVDGNTSGRADELTVLAEAYRADAEAVLMGTIKLDECVDPEAKVIYLTLGWKPEARPELVAEPAQISALDAAMQSGLTVVTIEVEGIGPDQAIAINDGLRLAVSQVYGERFVSAMGTANVVVTAEMTASDGSEAASSLASQSVATSTNSETSGVISGYRIIKRAEEGQQVRVRLAVEIPRYQPADVDTKAKLVVLPPRALPQSSAEFETHLSIMQRGIEAVLTQSRGLAVLDRENVSSLNAELSAIANEGTYRIEEIAKLGNRLGADLVLITEIGRFDIDRQVRKMGNRDVETFALRGEVWVKVVDVVTSATVFAVRIPVERGGLASTLDLSNEALALGDRVALTVGEAIGSSFPPDVVARIEAATTPSEPEVAVNAQPKIDAVKEAISDDW